MSMTYNTLFNQLLLWCNRNDADIQAAIPSFISQTEYIVAKECNSIGLLIVVDGSFTPYEALIQKPSRYRRMVNFNYGALDDNDNLVGQEFILNRDYSYCKNYSPNQNEVGPPQYYCDYDNYTLFVAPTPDRDYDFEMRYLQLDTPLTILQQTNWLTNYAPETLFYGCMWQAQMFLRNWDEADKWKGEFAAQMQSLNAQQKMRLTDGTVERADV